jgi:hypothetical protein
VQGKLILKRTRIPPREALPCQECILLTTTKLPREVFRRPAIMNRHRQQHWGDSRTRLRELSRLASPNFDLGISSSGSKQRQCSNPPKMNIWDALVVSVGLMQLIEAVLAHQEQSFSNHSKCVVFQLLRIFGPVVYLRESADDFKCELIVSDDRYAPSMKVRKRNHPSVTLHKERHNGNPLSRFIPCCRRDCCRSCRWNCSIIRRSCCHLQTIVII